jgi:putative membrane protein
LVGLERILTTPIPWSYSAHIWEVTYVYCLTLPFQLYGSGFGWVTVPATVVSGVPGADAHSALSSMISR